MKLAFYIGRKELNPKAKPFDMAVCWWTKGDFSHVELVIEGPDRAAVCWSSSFRDGGVRRKVIDLTTGRWVLVEIEADWDAAVKWFHQHEGQRYDIAGILGFVLPWNSEDKRKWFCSEAVAAALELADPWRYSPNKLYEYLKQPGESYA